MYFHKTNKKWTVCITVDGKRKSFHLHSDKKIAKRMHLELELKHSENKLSKIPDNAKLTIAQLCAMYLTDVKPTIAASTFIEYEYSLGVIVSLFGKTLITKFSKKDIKELKSYLTKEKPSHIHKNKKGVSLDRYNRYLAHVKRIYFYAQRELDYDKFCPILHIKKEPVKRKLAVYYSVQEIEKLFAYKPPKSCNKKSIIETELTLDIIRFGYYTGRRNQEVVGLIASNFQLDKGFYEITNNDKTARTNPVAKIAPLHPKALKIVEKYIKDLKPNQHLFRNSNNNPLTPRNLGQRVKRIFKHVGLKGAYKELRHSFASHLRQKGVSLEYIAGLLFHSSTKVTESVYAHLELGDLKKSLDVL